MNIWPNSHLWFFIMSKKVDKYNLAELIHDRQCYKSHKGFNRENSDVVYIRVYPNPDDLADSSQYTEMNIMDQYKNDRFISSINYLQTSNNIYFVFNFMENISTLIV